MKGDAKPKPMQSKAINYPNVEAELEALAAGYVQKRCPWTAEEIHLLQRFYMRVPLMKLAEKVNHTACACQKKADDLRGRGIKLECDK